MVSGSAAEGSAGLQRTAAKMPTTPMDVAAVADGFTGNYGEYHRLVTLSLAGPLSSRRPSPRRTWTLGGCGALPSAHLAQRRVIAVVRTPNRCQ